MDNPVGRSQVIRSIGTPLSFFGLALLIVEAFLATVLIWAELPSDYEVTGMYVGVGMFVLVTLLVFLLVWFRPRNLAYDKEAHLIDTGRIPFGSDSHAIAPNRRFEGKQVEDKAG